LVALIKKQMKWLIVGGDGQLGRSMQSALSMNGIEFISLGRTQLDISREYEISRILKELQPTVVINAAAWTDVDQAESAAVKAIIINGYGPGLLAKACAEIHARFIHISTDYVFSGNSKKPWSETDPLDPVSAYGRSKAEGERLVQNYHRDGSYIVRTAWLYSPWGKNFVRTMLRLALQETETVHVVNDQFGQPTSAADLAVQIHEMVDRDIPAGIYHGTNSGEATWFEFAQNIFELSGADPSRVRPVNSTYYPGSAKRPDYSVLGHQGWLDEKMEPMRNWKEALGNELPVIISAMNLEE
jgi:dTDP-4-dehydrorhamnose reductase